MPFSLTIPEKCVGKNYFAIDQVTEQYVDLTINILSVYSTVLCIETMSLSKSYNNSSQCFLKFLNYINNENSLTF